MLATSISPRWPETISNRLPHLCIRNVSAQIRPPSWIFKIRTFRCSSGQVLRLRTMFVWCESNKPLSSCIQEMYFPIRQIGIKILDFGDISFAIVPDCHTACKISSKSDDISLKYVQISIFKIVVFTRPPSWISKLFSHSTDNTLDNYCRRFTKFR